MSDSTDRVVHRLDDIFVCESSISFVDGSVPELVFRGYNIPEIVQSLNSPACTLCWTAGTKLSDQ